MAAFAAGACASRGSESVAARGGPAPVSEQRTTPHATGNDAVTDAVVLERIEDAARSVPPNAVAPRIALADLAYPRTQDEFVAMGGFALLLVTALCHDPSELPIAKVVSKVRGQELEIPLVASRVGQPPNARIPKVFGTSRFDGIYLLPVFVTRMEGSIVVYVGGGRYPLNVITFPPPPASDAMPASLDLDFEPREPSVDAMLRLIADELPILKGAPLAG